MKKKITWLVMSCCIAVVMLASCSPAAVKEEAAIPPVEEEEVAPSTKPTPPIPEPAKFEVISLDIKPPEATAGQTVSITAVVENTGDSEGTYNVILTVESVTIEAKEVTITPGSSKEVTFSLVKYIPGTYEIVIGGLSSTLTVKEKIVVKKKLVAKEIELKYDDGEARDNIAYSGGFIVDFTPPSIPFTIKEIRVYGVLSGSEWPKKNFDVEIWNKSYKIVWSSSYPIDEFQEGNPSWVDLVVPAIQVSDKFFIHVYTGTGRLQGIHIGADDSVANLHSGITLRTEEGITRIGFSRWMRASGKWFEDRNNVNWMVRVVGSFDASTPSPTVPPAPEIKPVVQIDTAHKTERELATKNNLEKLLAEYDVSKWIFTKSVVIEEGAIPHARSRVITLSTAYLSYDYLHLSTFIHEQLEMFFSTKTNKVNQAITELRALYPTVPTDSTGFQSDRSKQGTYKHLVLCFLEFSAIKELVNEETARLSMGKMGHYIWVYETVLSDAVKIEEIAQKYGLIIE